MAVRLSTNLKNALLGVFKTGDGYTFEIQAFDGSTPIGTGETIVMGTPASGKIANSSPVDLAIPNTREVNKLKLTKSYGGGGTLVAEIVLEGNEIVDFKGTDDGGIYRVQTLEIKL